MTPSRSCSSTAGTWSRSCPRSAFYSRSPPSPQRSPSGDCDAPSPRDQPRSDLTLDSAPTCPDRSDRGSPDRHNEVAVRSDDSAIAACHARDGVQNSWHEASEQLSRTPAPTNDEVRGRAPETARLMPHWVDPNAEQKRANEVFAAGISGFEDWWRCVLDWLGRKSAEGAGHVFRFDGSGGCGGASTVASDGAWVSRGPGAAQQGMQYPPDPPRAEEIVLVMR